MAHAKVVHKARDVGIRDHSYITQALVGGRRGVRIWQFLLILRHKIYLHREGRGSKKAKNVLT